VDHILTNTLLPDLSRKILGSMAEGEKMTAVSVTVGENGDFDYGFVRAAAEGASA